MLGPVLLLRLWGWQLETRWKLTCVFCYYPSGDHMQVINCLQPGLQLTTDVDVKVVNDEENRYWVRKWPSGGHLNSNKISRVSEDLFKPTPQTTTKTKMCFKKSLADGGSLLEYGIIVKWLQWAARSVMRNKLLCYVLWGTKHRLEVFIYVHFNSMIFICLKDVNFNINFNAKRSCSQGFELYFVEEAFLTWNWYLIVVRCTHFLKQTWSFYLFDVSS